MTAIGPGPGGAGRVYGLRPGVGVDEVITREFISWGDNTTISAGKSLDPHLYADVPIARREPCVWPSRPAFPAPWCSADVVDHVFG